MEWYVLDSLKRDSNSKESNIGERHLTLVNYEEINWNAKL